MYFWGANFLYGRTEKPIKHLNKKYPLGTKVWWEMLAVGHHRGDGNQGAEFSSIKFGAKGTDWSSDILHNTPWWFMGLWRGNQPAFVELEGLTSVHFDTFWQVHHSKVSSQWESERDGKREIPLKTSSVRFPKVNSDDVSRS